MPSAPTTIGAIDLHADTPMWMRWLGYDVLEEHTAPLPRAAWGGHIDLPRLIRGGFAAQFFGLVSLPLRDRGLRKAIDGQIDRVEQAIARSHGLLVGARTDEAVRRAHASGHVAALLGIEGAHALEGQIEALDHFAHRGVRYLGLVHFSANDLAFPAYGKGRNDSRGLTDFGRSVVQRCNELGVIVDLTHVNRRGFFDALEVSKGPLIVSHTGINAVQPHWRNLHDDQIHAVADRGGIIGIMFVPRFLGRDGVDVVAEHIEHVYRIAGEDVPALGSDWDGMIIPSEGLRDPSEIDNLLHVLRRKMPERVVEKIARENALRVLHDVPPRCEASSTWA